MASRTDDLARDFGLTSEQAEAVAHEGDTLLLACPGSGKTRTLVARAVDRLRRGDMVVLVTFTRAAADEMRERIHPYLNREQRRNIAIGTFDSMVARQARKHLPYARPPTRMEHIHLIRGVLKSPEGQSLTFDEVSGLVERANRRRKPAAPADVPSELWRVYSRLLAEEGLSDFATTTRSVLDAMEDGSIRPFGCDELLVDEFQDADMLQLDWIRAHALNGTTVMAVGDDDQSIYGWRAAMGAEGMQALEDDLSARRLCLTQCYRCPSEVLEPAVRLVARNGGRLDKEVNSMMGRGQGGAGSLHADTPESELDLMVTELPRIAGPGDTVAVLARTNRVADDAEMALAASGWHLRRLGGKSIWESEGAGLVVSLVELVTGAAGSAQRGLSTLGRWLHASDAELEEARALLADPALSSEVDTEITELAHQAGRRWRSICSDKPDTVLSEMREWLLLQAESEDKLSPAIASAERLLSSLMGREGTLHTRIDRATRAARLSRQDEDETPPQLTVATLHSAKGLEFDVVWILRVDAERLPHKDAENIEEERRLLYVGMTRAQRELRLSSSSPSPFLSEAGL